MMVLGLQIVRKRPLATYTYLSEARLSSAGCLWVQVPQ